MVELGRDGSGTITKKARGFSAPFDDRYCSSHGNVSHLVADLASAIESNSFTRRLTPASRTKLSTAVEATVINFYRLYATDPDRLLAIPSGSKHYRKSYVHHRSMIHVRTGLEALGYIQLARSGFWDPAAGRGEVARYKALPPLINAYRYWSLSPTMIELRPRKQLVEIRPSKQMANKLMKVGRRCPDTLPWPKEHRKFKAERENDVKAINKALKEQFVALHVKDTNLREQLSHLKRPVNVFQSDLHRVFVIDPFKIGRLVGGWWMTLPKDLRRHLRMSAPGKHPSGVVEVDYEAIHVRMLYAQVRTPCPDAAYAIDEWGNDIPPSFRKIIKTCTLTMINAGSKSGALKAIRKDFKKKFDKWAAKSPDHPVLPPKDRVDAMIAMMHPEAGCPPLSKLLDCIEAYHQPIRDRFYTGAGRELMFEDSELSVSILNRMIGEHGVTPLPLHDSYIVRHDYELPLRAVMEEEFKSRFGVSIPVKAERSKRTRPNADLVLESEGDFQSAWTKEKADYKLYYALLFAWLKAQPREHRQLLWREEFRETEVSRTLRYKRRDRQLRGRTAASA